MTKSAKPIRQSIDRFDLLPASFHRQCHIRIVCRRWAAMVFILLAVLFGTSAAVTLRAHRGRLSRAELAAHAGPLVELRRDCLQLRRENEQRGQWCDWVESARPDDSLLQTLASIADATDAEQTRIKIQSLQVKLPLEYPPAAASPPEWAGGRVLVAAVPGSDQLADQWLQRLKNSDRIVNVTIDQPLDHETAPDSTPRVQLTAIPQSTRVLP